MKWTDVLLWLLALGTVKIMVIEVWANRWLILTCGVLGGLAFAGVGLWAMLNPITNEGGEDGR